MAGDAHVLVKALLRPTTPQDLQAQLNAIKHLQVRIGAVLDQAQMQQLQQGVERVGHGFKTGVAPSGKIKQNVAATNKGLKAGAHQWNKIAQQMGMIEQFTIALKRIPVWINFTVVPIFGNKYLQTPQIAGIS